MSPQTTPQPQPHSQAQTTSKNGQLTRQNRSNELMPPPPPPKRIKRPSTVLDEDIYTTALSDIIARDFFPGVAQARAEELQSQSSWSLPGKGSTQKTEKGKGPWHRQDETPAGWGGETPATVATTEDGSDTETETETETGSGVQTQTPDISGMGLLAFQAKYTSEDNESFNKLLDKQNTSRRQKYAWLWAKGDRKKLDQSTQQKQIAGPDAAQNRLTEKDDDDENNNQQLIKTNLDARPVQPSTWAAPPENSLMFMPDSVEDTHETIAQRAELESRMGPKRVLYHNTRLPDAPSLSQSQRPPPQSPSLSAIQDAIAGRPRLSASEAGSAVYTGGETPRVNGYAFVDDDEEEDVRYSSSNNATPNPFTISQNRRREDLHHRMVDRMSRSKRAERSGSGPGSTSGSGPGSGKALTPAAQKLLKRVGNTPRTDTRSGSGNMWTPTPRRR